MDCTIFYSSAGTTETLVALPETNLIGGYRWNFLQDESFQVTRLAQLPNPKPTAEVQSIDIYSVALKSQAGTQRFQMVQGGVLPSLPLLNGAIGMITHPVSRTQSIHATLPVGGVDKTPLLVAVRDNSGSTGYHWEQSPAHEAGLKCSNHFYPPESQLVGAPGFRVFSFDAEESGTYTVQLRLVPPASKQAVATIIVALTAINQ